MSERRRYALGFILAFLLPAAAMLIRLSFGEAASGRPTLILFVIPITICAYLGGLLPGLLCTASSLLMTVFFYIENHKAAGTVSSFELVQWSTFIVAGVVISYLAERLHLLQERAQANEARLAAMFDSAMDGIVALDHQLNIAYLNPAAEKMFGYRAAALMGTASPLLVPERFRSAYVRLIRDFAESGEPHRLVKGSTMGLRASGEDFPIEATLSRVEIQGEPHCTLVLRDVSDRKRFEDALRQSEALYRSLFESLEEGVTLWDAEGRIEACNPAAERILGWPAHALGGLHYSEVPWRSMAADQTVFDLESLAAAIIQRSGNPILHRERRVIRADGKEMWTLQNGIPLHSGAPNTRPRVMITFVDITDRKAAEQALRERDAAEEASRLKSEFLATMSHELRTPLTGVIGFAEYLRAGQAGPVNDEQAECLDSVHKSSLNLLNLINAILDLSKIEAGKMELSPETFDVSEAVEEARNMISPVTNEKRIQLLTQVDPALSSVTLDRTKFVQVLYNLMSNGVKFTDAPGRVEVGVDVPEDRRIRIRVTDTGIGIDTRDLDKLFRNFHQLDGGDARRHEGTGLGLALTKKIVELQQGVITVDSTPGQGSVFTVTLPH